MNLQIILASKSEVRKNILNKKIQSIKDTINEFIEDFIFDTIGDLDFKQIKDWDWQSINQQLNSNLLINIDVNEIDFDGRTQLGYNVHVGYYAQNQVDFLDPDKTVLRTIEEAMTEGVNLKVRDILGSFLFNLAICVDVISFLTPLT